MTVDGPREGPPPGPPTEHAFVECPHVVTGRWDGQVVRDLTGPTDEARRRFVERWTAQYGGVSDTIAAIARYVPDDGKGLVEPYLLFMTWTFAVTPPGWSTIVDGFVHGPADGMRAVLSTDSYHWLSEAYQFYEPSDFRVPCGAPVLRAIPVPRSVLALPHQMLEVGADELREPPA
jgi:hypothetical protein